jgi:ferric-dicitrate binding protein FerR (iron transport regulator)
MKSPNEFRELMQRFIDDRDALEEQEYAELVDAVRNSPELAGELRDQLLIDDLVSQRLTIDRRHFEAQVQQRVDDHLRGEEELNRQANELRSIALARLEDPAASRSGLWSVLLPLSLALSLLVIAGTGLWWWQQAESRALLATIDEVEGQVVVRRSAASDQYAEPGLALRHGDRLLVDGQSSLSLRWTDGTVARVEAGSVIDLPTPGVRSSSAGKRLHVDRGSISAVVARQPSSRPMVFSTPHAEAIVRGTELYLRVLDDETHLEVAEGKVEFMELATRDAQLVLASEAAVAVPGEPVSKPGLLWPTTRERLAYLFAGGDRPTLVRSGSLMKPTSIEPQSDQAAITDDGNLDLRGGWFADSGAAAELAALLQRSGEATIDILLAPASVEGHAPATIWGIEAGDGYILALMQQGDRLLLATSIGNTHKNIELAPLPGPGEQVHLIVSLSQGRIAAYLDGAEQPQPAELISLGNRTGTSIVFGGSNRESSRWHGSITGIAVYDRAFSRDELAAASAAVEPR